MQILGNQGIQHNLLTLTGVLFNAVLILVFLPIILGLENMGKLFFLYETALFLFPVFTLGVTGLPGFYLSKLLPSFRNDYGLGILGSSALVFLISVFCWLVLGNVHTPYTIAILNKPYSVWLLSALLILFLSLNQFFAIYSHYLKQRINVALLIQNTKFTIPVLGILHYFGIISFDMFLILFVITFSFPAIWQLISLVRRGVFSLRINKKVFTDNFSKWLFKNSILYWWGGVAFVLFSKVDLIILAVSNRFEELAVYIIILTIVYFMHIPKSILGSVTGTIISYAMKRNDLVHLESIYKKSAVSLSIVGFGIFGFFYFVGWELLGWLPYGQITQNSFPILMLLVFAKLIVQSFGASEIIIAKSPFDKVLIPFQFVAGIVNLIIAVVLVPKIGISGAAISSFVTSIVFSLFIYLFLRFKYQIQPFSKDFLRLLVVTLILFPIFALGKNFVSGGIAGLVCFTLFLILYSYTIYKWGISNDFTYWVSRSKEKILKIIKTGT